MIFFSQLDLCDIVIKEWGLKYKYLPLKILPITDLFTAVEQKNEGDDFSMETPLCFHGNLTKGQKCPQELKFVGNWYPEVEVC